MFKPSKKFVYFTIRLILVHFLSYLFIGVVFKNFENYTVFNILDKFYVFRAAESLIIRFIPLLQILRSTIFAFILYPFYKTIIKSSYAWIKLFMIIWGFSVIGTFIPAPASIEGLIYTKIDFSQHLIALIKPTVQIFVFSWFFVKWENRTERDYS